MAGFMTRNILACVVPTILAFISVYWFRKRRKIKQDQSHCTATNNLERKNIVPFVEEIQNTDRNFDTSINSISDSSLTDNKHLVSDAKQCSFNSPDSKANQISESSVDKLNLEHYVIDNKENILLPQDNSISNSSLTDDKYLVSELKLCSFKSLDSEANQISKNSVSKINIEPTVKENILLPQDNSISNSSLTDVKQCSFNTSGSNANQISESSVGQIDVEQNVIDDQGYILLPQDNSISNSSLTDVKHLMNDVKQCSFNTSGSNANQVSESSVGQIDVEQNVVDDQGYILLPQDNSISNSSLTDVKHLMNNVKQCSFNTPGSNANQISESSVGQINVEQNVVDDQGYILLPQDNSISNSSLIDDKHFVNEAKQCSFNSSDSKSNQISEINVSKVNIEPNVDNEENILLPEDKSDSVVEEFSGLNNDFKNNVLDESTTFENIHTSEMLISRTKDVQSLEHIPDDCSPDQRNGSISVSDIKLNDSSVNCHILREEEIGADLVINHPNLAQEWQAINELVTKTVFSANAGMEQIKYNMGNNMFTALDMREKQICPVEVDKTNRQLEIDNDQCGMINSTEISQVVDDLNVVKASDSLDTSATKDDSSPQDLTHRHGGAIVSECDISSTADTSTLTLNELSVPCVDMLTKKQPTSQEKSISAYNLNQHQEVSMNSDQVFILEPLPQMLNENDCLDNLAPTEEEAASTSTFSQSASIKISVQQLVSDTQDSILHKPTHSNFVGLSNCVESESSISPPQSEPSVNLSDVPSEDSSDSGKGSEVRAVNLKTFENASNHCVFEFELPQELCGRLIGKHGKHVKFIKERSNANVYIKRHPYNPQAKLAVVEGDRSDVNNALELIRKKYPPSQFPNVSLAQTNVGTSLGAPLPESLQLHLPEGAYCDVILSSLVSAGHFFLQQPTHPTYPSLSTLDQCMLACYFQVETPQLPQPIEAGVICAAAIMSGWYRAQVVYAYENDECLVKFVDYGGYSPVPSSSLRQIRSDFMTLPFQASECYLANVQPLSEESGWTAEASATFEELAQGQILQAFIVDYADDGTPYVHLNRVQGITSTFINQELVNRGVAKWIEHH